MIKVRVRHLHAGLGLIALSHAATGCALPAEEEASSTGESAFTQPASTGTFELAPAYWTPSGQVYDLVERGSIDEFVRIGEKVTLTAPSWVITSILQPQTGYDVAQTKALKVTFNVRFLKDGVVTSTRNAQVTSWSGTEAWNLLATTASFTIPTRTDTIEYGITIVDPNAGSRTVKLDKDDFVKTAVFGGQDPLKHVIFDNDGATLRNRVVEGGSPLYGASTLVAYTDWRADTLVDKSSIDREIGRAKGFGRFGSYEMPIYGEIQYDVSYGIGFDGAWNGSEIALAANTASRLLGWQSRTSYETTQAVPAAARRMSLYFHVKAFLVVDYSRYGEVIWRKYNQGDRVLVREKWDNPGGDPNAHYSYALTRR